jgi:hypothetical protein
VGGIFRARWIHFERGFSFKNLTGWSFSFQIVNNLDAKEYGEFLEERKKVVEQQLQELKEKKEAKMLRA